ncbi:PIN domain-containing protein [soil metagenome]
MATFLDTNVLVYAFDGSDERKRSIAQQILDDESIDIVVSSQVLSEFYWTVTRKLDPTLAEDVAHDVVRHLAEGEVVPIDGGLVDAAIGLARRHRLALWDAAILVAASRAGCEEVLSEDLNDGEVIAGVRIRNPFEQ